MDVLEAIQTRRAVRDYTGDRLTEADLRPLIAAASWAPSALNGQSWQFTVITDRDLLKRISDESKAWTLKTIADLPRPDHFRDLFRDPTFDIFYHAPALVVISAARASQWATEECALAAQNLMLAAAEKGLGTCWIGFAREWLNTAPGLEALGLAADSLVVAPIVVGHPRTTIPPVPRKPAFVNWIGDRRSLYGREQAGPAGRNLRKARVRAPW